MANSLPRSVPLPTTRWAGAGSELAAQLRDGDEFVVIQDNDGDPVAGWTDVPEGVRLAATGEPERCSGEGQRLRGGDGAGPTRPAGLDRRRLPPPAGLAGTLTADYERQGRVTRSETR